MMTKIWVEYVFCKQQETILKAFLKILSNNRNKHIQYILNDKKGTKDSDISKEKAFPILHYQQKCLAPAELFINLRMMSKYSTCFSVNKNKEKFRSIADEWFIENPDSEIDLLNLLANSLLDLSLNEIGIHYIKTTKIFVDYPYQLLEDECLAQTNEFYQKQFRIFQKHPSFFHKFLKSDRNTLQRILRERTIYKLDDLIQQTTSNFVEMIIIDQIHPIFIKQLSFKEQKNCNKFIKVNKDKFLDPFMKELCGKVLFEIKNKRKQIQLIKCQSLIQEKRNNIKMEEEFQEEEYYEETKEDQKILNQLPMLRFSNSYSQKQKQYSYPILGDNKLQKNKSCFKEKYEFNEEKELNDFLINNVDKINQFTEFTQDQNEELPIIMQETICKLEIEMKNKLRNDEFLMDFFKEKNLNFKLKDTDQIFYSLCQNPSIQLIYQVYEKFQNFCQQYEKENLIQEEQDLSSSDDENNEDMELESYYDKNSFYQNHSSQEKQQEENIQFDHGNMEDGYNRQAQPLYNNDDFSSDEDEDDDFNLQSLILNKNQNIIQQQEKQIQSKEIIQKKIIKPLFPKIKQHTQELMQSDSDDDFFNPKQSLQPLKQLTLTKTKTNTFSLKKVNSSLQKPMLTLKKLPSNFGKYSFNSKINISNKKQQNINNPNPFTQNINNPNPFQQTFTSNIKASIQSTQIFSNNQNIPIQNFANIIESFDSEEEMDLDGFLQNNTTEININNINVDSDQYQKIKLEFPTPLFQTSTVKKPLEPLIFKIDKEPPPKIKNDNSNKIFEYLDNDSDSSLGEDFFKNQFNKK